MDSKSRSPLPGARTGANPQRETEASVRWTRVSAGRRRRRIGIRAAVHPAGREAALDRDRGRVPRAESDSADQRPARSALRRRLGTRLSLGAVYLHVAAQRARPHRDELLRALDVRLTARGGVGTEALHALLPRVRRRSGRADRDRSVPALRTRRARALAG